MHRVRGVAQHYPWGDARSIPRILGIEPDGRPWAEWWLGTHPGGPAVLEDDTPLRDLSGELPYLMKILAAAAPLSLQTHPSTDTAVAGFRRENTAGIPIDDPRRIYRDMNAKPELLCALTPFDALCGFRRVADTAALLRSLGAHDVAATLLSDGLAATVAGIYRGTIASEPLVRACNGHRSPQAELVTDLDATYPGDPSVAVTLFLNRVLLGPGDAIYLPPGNLHAYLHGVGVEVMGASDNVVRGGLTSKHVDVDELLRVLHYEAIDDPVVRALEESPGQWRYPTPHAPFIVTRIQLGEPIRHVAHDRELLLCTDGSAGPIRQGDAVYLASGESMSLQGPGTVFAVAAT